MIDVQKSALEEPRHPIQVVSRRTGLSADVIRVWERRYGAVSPKRNDNARRLYSDADVERLDLLRRATRAGHRIGNVAELDNDALRSLVADDAAAIADAGLAGTAVGAAAHLKACLAAAKGLDAPRLQAALEHAAASVSLPVLLEDIIGPLVTQVGEQWARGELRVFHEHMVSAQLAAFLTQLRLSCNERGGGPVLLVATPAGQHHELGALMAAVAAANEGWQVVYLNPNMPALELAAAARQCGAKAVALSVVYPGDDPRLPQELTTLRKHLAPQVWLLVGGRSAKQYKTSLESLAVEWVTTLTGFGKVLGRLRDEPS